MGKLLLGNLKFDSLNKTDIVAGSGITVTPSEDSNQVTIAADNSSLSDVDIVVVDQHADVYSKNTLEIVVNSSGQVLKVYFVSPDNATES